MKLLRLTLVMLACGASCGCLTVDLFDRATTDSIRLVNVHGALYQNHQAMVAVYGLPEDWPYPTFRKSLVLIPDLGSTQTAFEVYDWESVLDSNFCDLYTHLQTGALSAPILDTPPIPSDVSIVMGPRKHNRVESRSIVSIPFWIVEVHAQIADNPALPPEPKVVRNLATVGEIEMTGRQKFLSRSLLVLLPITVCADVLLAPVWVFSGYVAWQQGAY